MVINVKKIKWGGGGWDEAIIIIIIIIVTISIRVIKTGSHLMKLV